MEYSPIPTRQNRLKQIVEAKSDNIGLLTV